MERALNAKLQGKDIGAPKPKPSDPIEDEKSSPGPGVLSQDPIDILASGSSKFTNTQSYQAKSLLDLSDEASALTETTDLSSPDLNATYSDDEDDDTPLEEYNLGCRQTERRLTDPEAYFQDLRNLENLVIQNSYLNILQKSKEPPPTRSSSEESEVNPDVPNQNQISPDATTKGQSIGMSNVLFTCRQIMECCCSNVERLQSAKFCGEYITVITEDRNRSSVAKLHKVPTKIIFDLREYLRKIDTLTGLLGLSVNLYRGIIRSCVGVLSLIGMFPSLASELFPESALPVIGEIDERRLSRMLATLQATVEALDLSVVSYSGTHIQRFDQSYPYTHQEFFVLPRDKNLETGPLICLRRRRLMCMDVFLGSREVWVFHEGSDASRNEPLWLSTSIEELNDLWGPSWKLTDGKKVGKIQSIETGNGCILPWSSPKPEDHARSFPITVGNEVYSHWISSKDWDEVAVRVGQHGAERKFFTEDSTLLIGASPYIGLAVNPSCKPSKADLV
jgi:hypothetical protein